MAMIALSLVVMMMMIIIIGSNTPYRPPHIGRSITSIKSSSISSIDIIIIIIIRYICMIFSGSL